MRFLVLGFSDGIVKIYQISDLEKETSWEPIETIGAFVNVGGKKGAVT